MVAGPPAAAPAARGGAYRRACYVHMSFYRTFHVVGHVIWFLLLQICLLAEERVNSEGRLGWGEGNPGE